MRLSEKNVIASNLAKRSVAGKAIHDGRLFGNAVPAEESERGR
jgi:hypothetical protein